MAPDAILRNSPDSAERRMSIGVRDDAGPVMQGKLYVRSHQHGIKGGSNAALIDFRERRAAGLLHPATRPLFASLLEPSG